MGRDDWRIAGFVAGFFVVTSLSIALTRYGGGVALVWPGTAIAAALLIELPRARWIAAVAAIAGANVLATSLFGLGPRMAIPIAGANMLEFCLAAGLLLLVRPQRDWFDSIGGLIAFVALAGVAAPAVAAVPGGWAVSMVAGGSAAHHAESWFAAHGLGTLIGLPMMLIMTSPRFGAWQRWSLRRTGEFAGHLALVGAVAVLAIAQARLPLLFLPVVPLLLTAFRCGREGAVLGTLVIAGVAGATLQSPATPLAAFGLDLPARALFVQFYLATLSLLAIPVAVALRQHQLVLAELDDRKALTRLVADHADVALLNLDPRGCIRYASPAAEALAGEDSAEGAPLGRFFDPLDEPLVRTALAEAAAAPGETFTIERAVLRGEEQLWLHARICAVVAESKTAAVQGYAVTIRDITARKVAELAAIAAAETDALTGLPNRRALIRQLERALAHARQRPFALAIVDLDHFKAINDTHGHPAGDTALREVAGAMRRLATPGRMFARLGGEEFALITADGEGAEALCERLRAEIAVLAITDPAGRRFTVTPASVSPASPRRNPPATRWRPPTASSTAPSTRAGTAW